MIQYELLNVTDQKIDKEAIEKGLKAAEKKLKDLGERHVVIEVVTPNESKKINHELRQKNEPTDIISISSMETRVGEQVITEDKGGGLHFDLKQDQPLEHDWPVLGQLIICPEVITANAKRAGQPEARELEWVIEHGTLHLLGFHHDHDK